jgi:hypothetical protein
MCFRLHLWLHQVLNGDPQGFWGMLKYNTACTEKKAVAKLFSGMILTFYHFVFNQSLF